MFQQSAKRTMLNFQDAMDSFISKIANRDYRLNKILRKLSGNERLVGALSRATNKYRSAAQDAFKEVRGVISKIQLEADRLGMSLQDATDLIGTYITLKFVPEANAELLAQMVERRDAYEAMKASNNGVLSKENEAILQSLYVDIAKFESYNRGDPGAEKVPTRGGYSNVEATTILNDILAQGFDVNVLEQIRGEVTSLFKAQLDALYTVGAIDKATYDRLKLVKDYVPLKLQTEFMGENGLLNAAPDATDGFLYKAEGSMRKADHALLQYAAGAEQLAAIKSYTEYKTELYNTVRSLQGQAEDPQTVADMLEKYGVALTSTSGKAPAQGGIRLFEGGDHYNLIFADPRVFEAHKAALGAGNKAVDILTTATRFMSKMWVGYVPAMLPKSFIRTGMEFTTILSSRDLRDTNGNKIPMAKLTAMLNLTTMNPMALRQVSSALRGGTPTGEFGQAIVKLKELGALSLFTDQLRARTIEDVRSLFKKKGWSAKKAAEVDSALMHLQETANAVAPAGAFIALTKLGMSEIDAANAVISAYNMNMRGEWAPILNALYPFVNSTFQSGSNIIKNLQSKRGLAVLGYRALMFAALEGVVSSMFDDKDLEDRDNTSLSRSIDSWRLPTGDGGYVKVPIGFGTDRVAKVLGTWLYRASQNPDYVATSIGDLTSGLAASSLHEVMPLNIDSGAYNRNLISGLINTLTPMMMAPLTQTAMNMNAWGKPIHGMQYADTAAESGSARTASVWHDWAKTISDATGLDVFPETLRHLAEGYTPGPLGAIIPLLEGASETSVGKSKQTAKEQFGAIGKALGTSQLYDTGARTLDNKFYNILSNTQSTLTNLGVDIKDAGKGDTKTQTLTQRIQRAGVSATDAGKMVRVLEASTAIDKQKKIISDALRQWRNGSINELTKRNRVHLANKEIERIMGGVK